MFEHVNISSAGNRLLSFLGFLLILAGAIGCGGGGGGGGGGGSGSSGNSGDYSVPQAELYVEVPPIEISGGSVGDPQILYFTPKSPKSAELYDSDDDGEVDTPINNLKSGVNSANRMYDADLAACYALHTGDGVYNKVYQPDTMPTTAQTGTQFIQLEIPFDVSPDSLYDIYPWPDGPPLNVGNDYLTGNINIINDENEHVNCTVLLDGKDAFGNDYSLLLPPEIEVAPNVVVLIAQPEVDVATGALPQFTAFCSTEAAPQQWDADTNEMRIRIGKLKDAQGKPVEVNASFYVAKTGFDKIAVRPNLAPLDIVALSDLGVDTDIDPETGEPFASPHNRIVTRDSSFMLTFNKPIVPETLGRSLVFDRPPFNGNTKVVTNAYYLHPDPPDPCVQNPPVPATPLATNISLIASYIDDSGPSQTTAIIPFRCHPLHQNNLATYVIHPLIDFPGSTPDNLNTDNPIKVRVHVSVYPAGQNTATGDPDDAGLTWNPVNIAPASFFEEDFTGGTQGVVSRTFTVEKGGRYVNAPVCPNAIYYTMGPKGIGVLDLDGNGFTTNHPDTSNPALVTSLRFYNKFGNSANYQGNNYAYAAKAGTIGLGSQTSVPGINEGSNGMESVVYDSQGRSQLYPDPDGDEKYYNITDLDTGDFLDAMFFDKSNLWVKDVYHLSFLVLSYQGLKNNVIDTPPTPNPPPLTLPIGMRAVDVIIDDTGLMDQGAFVIMGKEVFTVPVHNFWLPPPPPAPYILPWDTSFVHLQYAEYCSPPSSIDEPFPPNPFNLMGTMVDFVNTGPLAESSTVGTGFYFGSRQQIGNFLFATDKSNDQVKVLNSNTMDVITSITGFSSPESLAVTTDLKTLYVSNGGSGYVSVFDVDPRSSSFLSHITDVQVGLHPKGICVQPEMDDVLVCNYGGNSVSIISPDTNTVRKTVSSLVNKPWDLVAGPRQTNFGWGTGVYHAYISNHGGDNVIIFESGPTGIGGIGYDDILDPVPRNGAGGVWFDTVEKPRGICWDPLFVTANHLDGGCFVAHKSGSKPMVSRIQFTKQQGTWGPIYIQPNAGSIGGATPGFGERVFEIVSQWGGLDSPFSVQSGACTDVALNDYNQELWLNNNWTGNPYVTNYGILDNNPIAGLPMNHRHPARVLNIWGVVQFYPVAESDRLYVGFQYSPSVDVIDLTSGTVEKTISGLDGPAKVLKSYFKF